MMGETWWFVRHPIAFLCGALFIALLLSSPDEAGRWRCAWLPSAGA